jgi:AAA family ATP:ADP antiporter
MRRLQSLLRIEPGEGRLVVLMLAHSFFIGSARIFALTSAFALFLAEFGAQTLPYVYIGISLVVTLASIAYLKLSARLSFSRLLLASVGFLLVSLLGFRLALDLTQARWLIFALPIYYEVLWTLTNLEFWNLAGRLLNVRQAKRLFGLIGIGWEVAIAVGGLLAPTIVMMIGTPNLLLLAAVSMAGVLGLLLYINRSYSDRLIVSTADKPVQREEPTSWRPSLYLLSIFGLFALLNIGYFVSDNLFYLQAEARYPGEDQLAGFIGLFFGVAAFLTLASRSVLTSSILNRYGVRVGLLLTPAFLLLSSVSAALVAGWMGVVAALFWLVALMRLITAVTVDSVDSPAINLLYQPLPPVQRVQAQTMAEGVVYSLSIGLAGVGLSIVTALSAQPTLPLVYFLILLGLAWLALAVQAGRLYPRQLLQALAKRWLGSADLSLTDAASIAVLRQAALDQHPAVALYALTTLESIDHNALTTLLQEALGHGVPEVRRYALERIEALGLTSVLPDVSRQLRQEADVSVRGAAVRCLAAVGGKKALPSVALYLDDPSLPVRAGAVAGLFRGKATAGVTVAGEKLLIMARAADPHERAMAARVLAQTQAAGFLEPLQSLLQDPDPEVQRAALLAAGRVGDERLWAHVVARLDCPPLRRTATAALVAAGQAALPGMAAAFALPGQSVGVQARLARAAGRIGGPQAVRWLEGHLRHPDAGVRGRVVAALSRCAYQAQEQAMVPVRQQIQAEAEFMTEGMVMLRDLGDLPAAALVRGALEEGLKQARARIFLLLAFLYDRDTVLRARDNLALPSVEKQAYALEVLDVLLAQDVKRIVLPLLAPLSPEQQAQQLKGRANEGCLQCLTEIVSAPPGRYSAWTRATALYAAGLLVRDMTQGTLLGPEDRKRLRRLTQTVLPAPGSLIGETATWVVDQLDGEGRLPAQNREVNMLTIEKVLALRQASIFSETSDETLAEIAPLLEEVSLSPGQTIFFKGDLGNCMYLIVAGEVRVHDGEHTLNHLMAGEAFGEMSVLDAEPRMASVTAVVETQLLRLDQEPLYEVIADHSEVSQGIIRALSRHLRARAQELTELRGYLKHLEA